MGNQNIFGKRRRTAGHVCKYIARADDLEIQQIMQAVRQRYAVLHTDWDVVYMAVHKEPAQRAADLQGIFAMLKKEEETDSLS